MTIVVVGFGINVILISLWVTIRYLQSSHTTELRKVIWTFGLFAIAVFSLGLVGFILIHNELGFYGANVMFSTVVGGALVALLARGSRFSEPEQYIILSAPFLVYRFEGKRFKTWAWAINSLYATTLLFVFASLVYFVTYFIFGKIFHNLDATLGIFIAISACCVAMVMLERCGIGRISERKKSKIYNLYHCLKLLSVPIDAQFRPQISKVVASYDLGIKDIKNRTLNLTMYDVDEVVTLISDDISQSRTLAHISTWVLRCQCSGGGFGVWPGSSPRLCSTYQALTILQDANLLDKCNADLHISWIKMLQQPNGFFWGPWSKKNVWEDTFHAVKSLNMLGGTLDLDKAQICQNRCQHMLVEKGIKENRPDVIYYCFGALTALGEVEDKISKLVSDWIFPQIEELLLTNISLNYENVHFSVMVYHLLNTTGNTPSAQLNLLTGRINTALLAELANIHA